MSSIGVNVGLQFLFASLGLASSALVLVRDRLWKWLDALEIFSSGNLQQIRNYNNTLADPQSQWYAAWLELSMAWYVGFASVWLLSILLLCITLKWPVPLLVVPNIALLVMGLLANAVVFGAILAWLLELPNDLRTDGHEQKALIFVAGLFGIILLFSIVFIALSTHHYHILRKIVRERSRITPESPTSSIAAEQRANESKSRDAMELWNRR